MGEDTYINALDAALKERDIVLVQLGDLEKRVARLNETIATLLRLINDDDNDPTALEFSASAKDAEKGLTDKVRDVLKAADAWQYPTEVRDGLERMGVDTQSYSNVMASIHTVLKRLAVGGEVEEFKGEGGKTAYKWKAQRHNWFDRIAEQFADDIVNTAKRTASLRQPKGSKVDGIEPRPKKTEGTSEEMPGLGNSLRKAAGLPPVPPKKSALREMVEKAGEKEEDLPVLQRPKKEDK